MMPLQLGQDRQHLRVLCLGAHSDDIEIGCAGTLLRWLAEYKRVDLTWVVFSAPGERAEEARQSAHALAYGAHQLDLEIGDFADTQLPADFVRAKSFLQAVQSRLVAIT